MHNLTTEAGIGIFSILMGARIWRIARPASAASIALKNDAAQLRAAGEMQKASKVEADADAWRRRLRIYARGFVIAGIVIFFIGLFASS